MHKNILRRELVVGVTGTAEELALSNFIGVKVEIAESLVEMAVDEQVNLAQTLSGMAVAAGLLDDPLIIEKGVCGVLLSEREVVRDLPDGMTDSSSRFMHFKSPDPLSNPPIAKVFFTNLARTIDDRKN